MSTFVFINSVYITATMLTFVLHRDSVFLVHVCAFLLLWAEETESLYWQDTSLLNAAKVHGNTLFLYRYRAQLIKRGTV